MARNVVSGKHHIAFIERYHDAALVTIKPLSNQFHVDHTTVVEEYETLGKGAAGSARKSIKILDAKAKG